MSNERAAFEAWTVGVNRYTGPPNQWTDMAAQDDWAVETMLLDSADMLEADDKYRLK